MAIDRSGPSADHRPASEGVAWKYRTGAARDPAA